MSLFCSFHAKRRTQEMSSLTWEHNDISSMFAHTDQHHCWCCSCHVSSADCPLYIYRQRRSFIIWLYIWTFKWILHLHKPSLLLKVCALCISALAAVAAVNLCQPLNLRKGTPSLSRLLNLVFSTLKHAFQCVSTRPWVACHLVGGCMSLVS